MFRVLQNEWEISRLQKAIQTYKTIDSRQHSYRSSSKRPTVDEAVYGASATNGKNSDATNLTESCYL